MESFLFFLPSMLCLLLGFQYLFRKKNKSQTYMMYLLYTGAFYYFAYAFYISPKTDYDWLCRLDSINEPLFLYTCSLFITYIHHFIYANKNGTGTSKRGSHIAAQHLQWLTIPVIAFGAINLLMYYLVGYDNAANIVKKCDEMNLAIASPEIIKLFCDRVDPTTMKLFGLFNQTIYNAMALLYVGILVVSCLYCSAKYGYRLGDVTRFFCMGHETVPARAASACSIMLVIPMSPLLIVGRTYFVHNLWAGVTMTAFIALAVFILANAEMMSHRKVFTMHDIVTSSLAESGIQINANVDDNVNDDVDHDTQNSQLGGG